MSELRRPTPPDLEFRAPDCPICLKETEGDPDGYHCDNCKVWWDTRGERGEWYESDEPGCPSTIEWYNTPDLDPKHEIIRHERERCILPAYHGTKHMAFDSWHTWDDDDPRVVPPS